MGGAIARAGMLVGLAQARRRIFATLPSGLHIPPAVQRSVGVRPVRWRVSPAAGGSAGQVRAGAPAVRRAHSLAGHMGDGDYEPDDDSDMSLANLLKPVASCELPDYDPQARCVVVRHTDRPVSWVERSAPLQTALESRGEETPPMFMVVVIKGKQYKLTMDDVVISESMGPDIDVNETVRMEGVMLVGSKDWTVVGTPQVPSASIDLQCEEHVKTAKMWIFKKKRRKGYARNQGHRQKVTMLRVVGMNFDLETLQEAEMASELEPKTAV